MNRSEIATTYSFFRDFLRNFAQLIDDNVGRVFRKIEFNIQDRTFLYKDFSQEIKLPALHIQVSSLQIRYDKFNPLKNFQLFGVDEVFSVVLLLNETKQEYIIATCQPITFNLDLQINTASQLEELEIINCLNQMFVANQTFQWSFTTFIPLTDKLLEGWDLTTDEIYYLFEQKLTEKKEDKIIAKTVYYALYQMEPLITVSPASTYPTQSYSYQSGNMSFTVNTFVPSIIYRNEIPSRVQKVVYTEVFGNEPTAQVTQDLLNNVEEKTKLTFYRGYIISNDNTTQSEDGYVITVDFSQDPKNFVFFIRLPDNTNIVSTQQEKFIIESWESNTLTIKIKNLSEQEKACFDKIVSGDMTADLVSYKKE